MKKPPAKRKPERLAGWARGGRGAREATPAVVLDLNAMFVDMVAERRGMDRPDAEVASGRRFRRLPARTLAEKTFLPERLTLDGMISLWQPDGGWR